MPSPLFLAMTAAEFQTNSEISSQIAWMACHFSPYGTGLSNCPQALPPGSMLILNDRTPVCGHSPQVITKQLASMVEALGCSRVLLDFQRPGEPETAAIANAIVSALACPVGVSAAYAKELDCPVLLPPLPLHKPLADHIAPWEGRAIWLEAALDTAVYTVTQAGCKIESGHDSGDYPHIDAGLHCRYRIDMAGDAITFTLHRNWEDLQALMAESENIQCFVGLYQELAQAVAHSTAFFQ